MSTFYSDIGDSAELREVITQAVRSGPTVVLYLGTQLVMVTIDDILPSIEEMTVMCTDAYNKATIVLHLPYSAGSVAQADIISYMEGE